MIIYLCRETIQCALRRFILLLATRRNITMILDALLLLSSWGGNLDVHQYILKEHSPIMDQLKCAFQFALADMPAEHQHQWYGSAKITTWLGLVSIIVYIHGPY